MKKKREGKKKSNKRRTTTTGRRVGVQNKQLTNKKKRERYQMVWVRVVGCTGDLSRVAIQLMAKGGRPQERGKKNH